MRKKVLIYTTRNPFPILGGDSNRVIGIANGLAKYFDVTLIFNDAKPLNEVDYAPLDKSINTKVFQTPKISRRLASMVSSVVNGNSLQQGLFLNTSVIDWINKNQEDYDFIYFHLLRSYYPEYNLDNRRVIVDLTDCLSMAYERLRLDIFNLKSWFFYFEKFFIRRAEIKVAKLKINRLFVSETDKNYFKQMVVSEVGRDLIVQQGTVGIDEKAIGRITIDFSNMTSTLAFIGNMYTIPNKDAVDYFLKANWEKLQKKRQCELKIIGKVSSEQKKRWEQYKGVKCLGFVEELEDVLAGVDVGIAPMRLGSGMQNKVLEFMKLGIPVFGTNLAFAGFDNYNSEANILAAEFDVDTFIGRITDHKSLAELSLAELKYIYEYGRWDKQIEPLVNLIRGN